MQENLPTKPKNRESHAMQAALASSRNQVEQVIMHDYSSPSVLGHYLKSLNKLSTFKKGVNELPTVLDCHRVDTHLIYQTNM